MRGPTCNILHHTLPPKLLTYDSNSSRRSYIRMFGALGTTDEEVRSLSVRLVVWPRGSLVHANILSSDVVGSSLREI